jgi:hypothetical protein
MPNFIKEFHILYFCSKNRRILKFRKNYLMLFFVMELLIQRITILIRLSYYSLPKKEILKK